MPCVSLFGVSCQGKCCFFRAGSGAGRARAGRDGQAHSPALFLATAEWDAVPQPGLTSLPWLHEHPNPYLAQIGTGVHSGWVLRAVLGLRSLGRTKGDAGTALALLRWAEGHQPPGLGPSDSW